MSNGKLNGVRVAILAADGFEQVELTQPRKTLNKEGAFSEVISLKPGKVQGINLLYPGKKEKVDRTIFEAVPENYDALLIPGGFINPDFLRQSQRVLDFVRDFDAAGKPIATLCHGPWVLASAGLVRGRRLACWAGIQDDITNAGGIYVDKSVVKDGNWISSRDPHDLIPFCEEMVAHFNQKEMAQERTHSALISKNVARNVALGAAAVAAVGLVVRGRNVSRSGDT